jgi:predicted double-glycine peptidase
MMARLILTLLLVPTIAMGTSGGVWLDVPYVHQEKEGCGSAAIAMVLQYWSQKGANVPAVRIDAVRIQQELYSKASHGIHASDMIRYLSESGFSPFAFHGEWSDLKSHIEKGRPLIAAIQPAERAALHYVVIVGLDSVDEAVLLNDPERGKLIRVERQEFEKEWKRTENWTLLAVPKTSE